MISENDNYEKLGFKCGLEIHVQLNTEKKLFCDCPNKRSAEFPIKMARKIRPSAGEMGKMDPAAMHEFLRGRTFYYGINKETACLVETDEEQTHEINKEAMGIALSVAKSLKCTVPDVILIMRKIVADGSAVSGFQRTALAGLNGFLATEAGGVRITNLSLEEDSATPVNINNDSEFRLDRLGVPLVEIGTGPDIKNPKQARLTAERIGMLLFGSRLRGIGTIRQDLNVSIKGGARVEIKGVQELDKIEPIIENEIRRQQSLIAIKDELARRNASIGGIKDVTGLIKDTKSSLIQKSIKEGGTVYAGLLKGFAGLMKNDCGGKTFGKELSSYAGVFGLGLIHSDEIGKFPFLSGDFAKLRKELAAGENDLLFIVAGKGAEKACDAVMERGRQCLKGVPEETRAANPDSTTTYMRPLPGSARMYPETDVPTVRVKELGEIKPLKPVEEKLRELERILPKQMAEQMLRSEYLELFEELSKEYEPVAVANVFLSAMKDMERKGIPVENITDDAFEKVFSAEKSKIIAKESISGILEAASKGARVEDALKTVGKISEKELRLLIKSVLSKNPHLVKDKKISALMGEVMKEVRGRISGEIVMKVLKEELEKT